LWSIVLKKQVEKYFMDQTSVVKSFFVKNYVNGFNFTLQRLRRKCSVVFFMCFLVDFYIGTEKLTRAFSVNLGFEFEQFEHSILKNLKFEKWPNDC
jgi:hypothetical protein